jgi:citrate lyase gamma subunit
MNVITKVSDLSIQEFRALIRKTILETLNELSVTKIKHTVKINIKQ